MFHALHSLETSPPGDTALLVFYNQHAAAGACELFNGYRVDSTCSLEVRPAPRQALQRLAQMLVRCMQAVSRPGRGTRSAGQGWALRLKIQGAAAAGRNVRPAHSITGHSAQPCLTFTSPSHLVYA